jgi:putative membrane protein
MTRLEDSRKPAAFRLDDPQVRIAEAGDDAPTKPHTVRIVAEAEPVTLPVPVETARPPRRGFRWGALFWSAAGGLVSLAVGLSVTRLIEDLFARSPSLGIAGAVLAGLAGFAILIIAGREIIGLLRLTTIEKLHRRAAEVLASDDRMEGRAVVRDLLALSRENPRLAHGRAKVTPHLDDIIDGADLIRLAERELMVSLDAEARRLISSTAQRVSVVTAVSPRAAIDILFVLISGLSLIRRLARLYGGRPGALGLARLARQVVAHLAVTGGMAMTDSIVQQALGHGIAAKLSSRLGEGVLNGFLTARLGLAAVDLIRPMPFVALPRPVLSDLAKDLMRGRDKDEQN